MTLERAGGTNQSEAPRRDGTAIRTEGIEMMTRKIVLGVDGSDGSTAAIEWCARFARDTDADVVAVHGFSYEVYPYAVNLLPHMDDAWRKDLLVTVENEWCAPLEKLAVRYRAEIVEEAPARALMLVAEREHADLIVVGRRGRGGFAELLLGSVSHQLTHHARHPVVVVPRSPG